jgi:hypothetical protein
VNTYSVGLSATARFHRREQPIDDRRIRRDTIEVSLRALRVIRRRRASFPREIRAVREDVHARGDEVTWLGREHGRVRDQTHALAPRFIRNACDGRGIERRVELDRTRATALRRSDRLDEIHLRRDRTVPRRIARRVAHRRGNHAGVAEEGGTRHERAVINRRPDDVPSKHGAREVAGLTHVARDIEHAGHAPPDETPQLLDPLIPGRRGQVHVRVEEPGHRDQTRAIDHESGGLWCRTRRNNRPNAPVANRDVHVRAWRRTGAVDQRDALDEEVRRAGCLRS